MNCYVVTEGEVGTALLTALLIPPFSQRQVSIVDGRERSSSASLARTFLAKREPPVALVVDAEVTEANPVRDLQSDLEGLLSAVAVPERFKVFLAVPAIEAIFFDPNVVAALEKVAGSRLRGEASPTSAIGWPDLPWR